MKCKICGADSGWDRRCFSCMKEWKDNRKNNIAYLENIYGKTCPENHSTIVKELKKLERLFKKDEAAYYAIVKKVL